MNFILLYVYSFIACMYVCRHLYSWHPLRPAEGIRAPETEVLNCCAAMWVLGIESGFSGRETGALNYWTISSFSKPSSYQSSYMWLDWLASKSRYLSVSISRVLGLWVHMTFYMDAGNAYTVNTCPSAEMTSLPPVSSLEVPRSGFCKLGHTTYSVAVCAAGPWSTRQPNSL